MESSRRRGLSSGAAACAPGRRSAVPAGPGEAPAPSWVVPSPGSWVAGPWRVLVFICPRPSRAPAPAPPPHPDRRDRGPSLPGPRSAGGLSRTRVWRAALPRPPPSRPDKLRAFQIAPLRLGGRGAGGPGGGEPPPRGAGLLPCWVPGPPRSAEPNLAHLNNV